jgi:hypothetical protein
MLPTSIVAVLALGPFFVGAGQIGVDQESERRFLHSVEAYMTLCRQLERQLPPLEITSDPRRIHIAVEARAAAIRRARARARMGDIFNPGVTELFRERIREGFAAHANAAAELLNEMTEDGEEWQPAVVNGRFSWRTAVATPPYVLAVLPVLPGELQYRFVGPDLVLVDTVANSIIDVLPEALEVAPHSGAR